MPHIRERPVVAEQIRSLLGVPVIYQVFGALIGGSHRNTVLVNEYVRPKAGDRILDIGCGPGTIVPYLPRGEYIGFDISREYVNAARVSYGDRGTFVCERVNTYSLAKPSYFDVALAIGVLHHLDDEEASRLFHLAHAALKPGGKLVTLDGCLLADQPRIARYFVSRDCGKHVRTRQAYLQIASPVFPNISASIRHDLLRVPYTLIILECTR